MGGWFVGFPPFLEKARHMQLVCTFVTTTRLTTTKTYDMKKEILLLILCGFALVSMAQLQPISHCTANNVSATILGDGSCLIIQQENELGLYPCPTWEVPAGSGKQTIFQHFFWVRNE